MTVAVAVALAAAVVDDDVDDDVDEEDADFCSDAADPVHDEATAAQAASRT